MKNTQAFVMPFISLLTLIAMKCCKQHRLSKCSDDKMTQQRDQGIKQARMLQKQNDENRMIEMKFDVENLMSDPEKMSEDTATYNKYLAERQTLSTKHDAESQQLLQENKIKETATNQVIQQAEDSLKVVNADIEGMQAVVDSQCKSRA